MAWCLASTACHPTNEPHHPQGPLSSGVAPEGGGGVLVGWPCAPPYASGLAACVRPAGLVCYKGGARVHALATGAKSRNELAPTWPEDWCRAHHQGEGGPCV